MPASTALFGLLVILLAATATGVTGFGLGLLSTPFLVILLPPKVVVPLLLLHGTVTSAAIAFGSRKWLDPRRMWPLMLAGISGVPLGTHLLLTWDGSTLKVFIGVVITLFALAFLLGFRRELRNERLACGLVGFVSGVLKGSVGMSGSPIALFFANQGLDKQSFRANIALYFTALNLVTVPAYLMTGLMTTTIATYAALSLPALGLGMLAGVRLSGRVQDALFRRVTLVVVMGAGLVSVLTGLRAL